MPIKFRCQHCRQLLGISRSKSGTAVDCPKCGRLVLVPDGSGPAKAVVKPQWNLRDPVLSQALDELASIGRDEPDPADSGSDLPVFQTASAPLPAPVPVVSEPPIPTEPPKFGTMSAPLAEPVRGAGLSPSKQPAVFPTARGSGSGSGASPDMVAGALASLAAAGPAAKPVVAANSAAPPPRRHGRLLMAAGCTAAALATACIGFALGQRRPDVSPAPDAHGRPEAELRGMHAPAPAPAATAAALTGRISYINQSGESQPDRGARVIVLPTQREGTALLSVIGFRPGDAGTDFKLASAAARVLGGDLAVAADDGSFRVALPGAGEYQLLVLSHYQSREQSPPPAPLRSLLEAYFDRPDQLLGRFACHDARIRYKGTGTDVWDYSFAKP